MRPATIFFLVSLAFTAALTVVSAQNTGRICPQGGAVPTECPDNYHWDNVACRWVCNADVNCYVNPCDAAVRDGICPKAFCKADYSKGCNFKCSKCRTSCDTVRCAGGTQCVQDEECNRVCKPKPDICIQGGKPPAECAGEGQYEWDNQACKWICKKPVQCLIDPCQNAARDGICPLKSCVADYSKGCNFKCSKCSLTCATIKCAGGTECVQDEECNAQCKPLPNICPQGGQVPAECPGEGQHEWDNKACKWVCKCRSNEGNWISIGEQYRYKCNSCSCAGNGQPGICTKIGCSNLDICYDDQGKGYKAGETIKQDCNTCTCSKNGQWGCTKIGCPAPTPVPTSAPGPDICPLGGKVPAECPTTNVWDSKACQFVCVPPPSHCSTSCASAKCGSGTVCEQDQKCNVRCTPVGCTNTCKTGSCVSGATCIMNMETCAAECKPRECTQNACIAALCLKGTTCSMNEKCDAQCLPTTGVIVLSATFTVTMKRTTNTISDVTAAMRRIATLSGPDVLAAFVISNADVNKKAGNSGNYKWSVKIGIKADTETERKSLLSRYVAEASNTIGVVRTSNADQDAAVATVDSDEDLVTEEAMMAMQSCPDGSEISVADQCPLDTLAVPAAASSSSSSTPLVAIIVPIVAGVVLLAVIATAVVVMRRRANTIKSMNNVQQDTQMAQRV